MGLSVTIVADKDAATASASASGTDQHVITPAEIAVFGITDAALKDAVGKNFGQVPDDAYLTSPTPWGDLYASYGWPQVSTVVVVQSATVLGVTSQPTVVATNTFTNSSTQSGTFECGVTQSVENTAEESWSSTDAISVAQSISYEIGFLGTGAGGETSLSYEHTWEQGGSESETFAIGSTQGVSVPLAPGQSVEAVLSASRGTMQVEITYNAYLVGDVAVNYGDTYQGHHFWALDIGAVMSSGGIPNAKTYTETIEIGFYADATTILQDPQTNEVVSSFSSLARPAV